MSVCPFVLHGNFRYYLFVALCSVGSQNKVQQTIFWVCCGAREMIFRVNKQTNKKEDRESGKEKSGSTFGRVYVLGTLWMAKQKRKKGVKG